MMLQPPVGPTMARAQYGPEVTSPAAGGETGSTGYDSGYWDDGFYGCPAEDPYWYGTCYDFYTYEPYDYETEYWQDDQSAADEASTHQAIDQAGETRETTDEQSGPDEVSTHEYTCGHDDYGYGCYGYDDYGYGCYGDYYADYYTGYYGDGSEQSAPAEADTEQADDDPSDVHTYEEAEIVDRYGYWDGRAEAPVEELPAPPGPEGFRESDDESADTADSEEDATLTEGEPEPYDHEYRYDGYGYDEYGYDEYGYDGYGYDGYGYGEYYYQYDYDAYHDERDTGADPETADTSDQTAEDDAQDAGTGTEYDAYCEYGCYYEYGCYCDAYHYEYDAETADMADAAPGDDASIDAEMDDTPDDTTKYDYYGKYGYYDEYGYYGEYYHDAYHYEYDTDAGADTDGDTSGRSAQHDAAQYDGYCEYGYYDEDGYPYAYYDGYDYRYEYPYEYVTEPGATEQTAEESLEPSETAEPGMFIDDLDPFTWYPRDLLQTADRDLLRTLNGLFEERANVRELALNEYIEGLGLDAVEFVARFEEAFGHEALMLHDDLPGVAALLATYRMIERGELGMNDGVEILRRRFNHLSPRWIEEVSLIVTELPERSAHHTAPGHGDVVPAVLSASARSLGSVGSGLLAMLNHLPAASAPLAAIGDGWPALDTAAVRNWIAR